MGYQTWLLLIQLFLYGLCTDINVRDWNQGGQEILTESKPIEDEPGVYFAHGTAISSIRKVAIIGSGITGAIAAFNLFERGRLESEGPPEITIFERNSTIGGRVTTTRVYGDPKLTIDTCARSFTPQLDSCISRAASEVGLTVQAEINAKAGTGVWDGSQFIGFIEDDGIRNPSTWTLAKRLRWFKRYGAAPFRLNDNLFVLLPTLYGAFREFSSINETIERSDLRGSVRGDLCDTKYLNCTTNELDKRYLKEVVQASTRDRFFGNNNELNGLDSLLGLYASTQSRIAGGNLRLIDRLIKLSGAKVNLRTAVTKILFISSGKWQIETNVQNSNSQIFDAVIIAAPISLSNIELPSSINMSNLPKLEYIDTVVTHFTTSNLLNATYFNTTEPAPQNILTIDPQPDSYSAEAMSHPPFFSLVLVSNSMQNPRTKKTESLYKIVSKSVLSDDNLARFISRNESITEPAISWIDRQVLRKSVPRLQRNQTLQDKLEVAPRLFYAGGGEQIASQIETGCRVGASVALLITNANRLQT